MVFDVLFHYYIWYFRLGSRECFIFNGLRDFLVLDWWFLVWWKLVKCLIFQCFVELGIEVVFCDGFGWNVSETLILQGVCGWNRYAVPGFRMPVLKCKPRPLLDWKRYYNSTVLWCVFIVSSKNALHLQ